MILKESYECVQVNKNNDCSQDENRKICKNFSKVLKKRVLFGK